MTIFNELPTAHSPNIRIGQKGVNVHAGTWAKDPYRYQLFGQCFEENRTHLGRAVITSDPVTCTDCATRLRKAGHPTAGCTLDRTLTELRLTLLKEFEVAVPVPRRALVRFHYPLAPEVLDVEALRDLIATAGPADAAYLREQILHVSEATEALVRLAVKRVA